MYERTGGLTYDDADGKQIKFHMITIENLVPEKHFLRKLSQVVDFSFIYEETKDYYCEKNGRPSIDPVVLIKYLLIGFLYGIYQNGVLSRRFR